MKPIVSLALLVLFGFLPGSLPAADINYYGIIKSQSYFQTPSNAPALLASNAFMFNAFAYATGKGIITNATLHVSSTSATKTLAPESNDSVWRYTEYFNTSTDLETAYPAGSSFSQVIYAVTMATINDGLHTENLDFFLYIVALAYPSIPQITNLAAGQAIDTTQNFTLAWNSLGGSTLDVAQLTVFDSVSNTVFASPAPFSPNALNGASTSILIPANTLPAGTNLQAHLLIARPDLPNTAYATGVAALARDTMFGLATLPLPAAPRLTVAGKTADTISIHFDTEPSRLYHLQSSETLTNWTDLLVTNTALRSITYPDTPPAGVKARFYRVKVGS